MLLLYEKQNALWDLRLLVSVGIFQASGLQPTMHTVNYICVIEDDE